MAAEAFNHRSVKRKMNLFIIQKRCQRKIKSFRLISLVLYFNCPKFSRKFYILLREEGVTLNKLLEGGGGLF